MGCGSHAGGCGGNQQGTSSYQTKMKKPLAMVSQSSIGSSFGPYGARKASEVIGRTRMPPMPGPRTKVNRKF